MKNPLDLIQGDMQRVDQVIGERLTTEVPLVREVAQYIISAGGKRLRPALLLLISGALGSLARVGGAPQLKAAIDAVHL